MDLTTDEVCFKGIGVNMPMVKLPSGHRAVPLVQWDGTYFPVPETAKQQFKLSDDAFMKSQASSRYIRSSCFAPMSCKSEQFSGLEMELTSGSLPCQQEQVHADPKPLVEASRKPLNRSSRGTLSPLATTSAAQMGNISDSVSQKFDIPSRVDKHGQLVSLDERRGGQLSDDAVAPADASRATNVGDDSGELRQAGLDGNHAKEPRIGEEEVFGGRRAGAWEVPPSSSSHSACQPIRHLVRVPPVLGQDFVCAQVPKIQSKGQSEGLPRRTRTYEYSVQSSSSRPITGGISRRDDDQPGAQRADPARAELHAEGNALGVSGDEPHLARPSPRTGSDAPDDAAGDPNGHIGNDSRPGLRDGEQDRGAADAGGRGWGPRGSLFNNGVVAGELSRAESERARPPALLWPKALAWCAVTSQLLSWQQLSPGFQQAIRHEGGDESCWAVHYRVPEDWRDLNYTHQLPTWLQAPWVAITEEPKVSEEIVWHDCRDEQGLLQERGPGASSRGSDQGGGHRREWVCTKGVNFVQRHRDPAFPLLGYDENLVRSSVGPYWVLRAPRLQGWFTTEEMDCPAKEVETASEKLVQMAREQRRATSPLQLDYMELFQSTATGAALRRDGIRVLPEQEGFTAAAGWRIEKKEHRSKLREVLDQRRPAFVFISLSDEGNEISDCLRQGLGLEVMKRQVDEGRFFLSKLDFNVMNRLRRQGEWSALLQDPEVCLASSTRGWWMTNHPEMHASLVSDETILFERPLSSMRSSPSSQEEAREEECLAKQLLRDQDFSMGSCLRLLNSTRWPASSRRRSGDREDVVYAALGQFSHGKFSGITKHTLLIENTVRYLNGFMTYHGALGPRSSLAISRNNRMPRHRDVNNTHQNYSIALGKFSGGELWTEKENGKVMREVGSKVTVAGELQRHRKKMVEFDPKRFHGVEPWQGDRWSITAFRTRSVDGLDVAGRERLQRLGFQVEGYNPGSHYEDKFVDKMRDFSRSWTTSCANNMPLASFPATIEEEMEEDIQAHPRGQGPEEVLSEAQKNLVRKLHVNTGHPPRDRFLRTLRAAGALDSVLKYVRDKFVCENCAIRQGPDHRRKAQCPRTFAFNRILSIDVFYVPFKETSVAVLNMVCHGTGYQVAQRIEASSGTPSAAATWKAFLQSWVRFLGPPYMVITDGGNEFHGIFERGLEQLGILQHTTAPESPWQNSKAERHGGWLKQKLKQEIQSGQCVMSSLSELDDFLSQLTAAKNRWYNSGGYTPTQLVFGELPRVPGELLSEDPGGLVPLADAFHDPGGLDEAGVEFRRRAELREKARQLAMQAVSKDVIQRAAKTSMVPTRTWSPGQWVYCFRRGKAGDTLHPTPRWVGPGLVVLANKSVIWVAMRTRLWRCSPEQLRSAFPSEVLGRQIASDPDMGELLRQVVSGGQAGAVDVSREGPPTGEDHLRPVERVTEGVPLPRLEPTATGVVPEDPAMIPSEVPVPPGLLPVPHLPRGGQPVRQVSGSTAGSRRSSTQEPAQEPESSEGLFPVPEEGAEPPYGDMETSRADREDPALPEPRPLKVPRIKESGSVSPEPQASSSSTSATPNPTVEESTRAPGTPIGRLLDMVQRGRSEPGPEEGPPPDENFSLFAMDEEGAWSLVASRADEVDMRQLCQKEQALFKESDELEWSAILKTKAVRVIKGLEARKMREMYPERVLNGAKAKAAAWSRQLESQV